MQRLLRNKIWDGGSCMRIGPIIGGFCGLAAVLFLAINSQILYRGAAAWGLSEWDRISYGIVGATVPWIIAICPFLFVLSLKRGWRGIVTISVAIAVWLIFVVYNFVGAMGSIAAVRGQVIAERQGAADTIESLKYQRSRLQDELGWIPKRRPAGQIAAALEAEKLKAWWLATEECTDIRGPGHRRYCTAIEVLKGELAAARKSDDLNARIAAITAKIEGRQPVASKADPTAYILTSLFGVDEKTTSERLPIATPIILEIGSMTLLYFAFVLLGLNHTQLMARGVGGSSDAREPGKDGSGISTALPPSPSPAIPPPMPSAQRELAENFFRAHVRPAPDGQLTEADWYGHYCKVCARSNDKPLPVEAFRWIARRYVPAIKEVGGTTYFLHVLPLLPKEDAA